MNPVHGDRCALANLCWVEPITSASIALNLNFLLKTEKEDLTARGASQYRG